MTIAKLFGRICKAGFFLSLMILILAVGCAPAPIEIVVITQTSSPVPTIKPTETQVPISTPTHTATPTLTPFVPTAVIKIVSHVPLSGDQTDFGQDILHGAQLAVQQLSGPLNALGYGVELVPYDDQNLAQTALTNAQQIMADSQILCGVGHYDSVITIAASDIYHQAGLAWIVPSVTDPILTDRSFLEVNRLIGRIDGQGIVAARFAKDRGFTRVYIVTATTRSNLRNADAFRVESGRLGIKRVGTLISNLSDSDYNMDAFVQQIIDAKPDLIYISNSARQAVAFLTKLRAAGYTGAFLGTEKLDSRSVITNADDSLVRGDGMFYTIMDPPVQYYSEGAKFIQDFHNQFDTDPRSSAARAYDATGICLKAIEEASNAKAGMVPTRAEVAQAIRNLKGYKGITGNYSFNNHGDPDPVQYYVYQVVSTDTASWDQNPIVAAYPITPP